jgi:hypothetical protein
MRDAGCGMRDAAHGTGEEERNVLMQLFLAVQSTKNTFGKFVHVFQIAVQFSTLVASINSEATQV